MTKETMIETKPNLMMKRSNISSSIPISNLARGGHLDSLTIKTINVRGIRKIVENWHKEMKSFKMKWDNRIKEKKEEEKKENNVNEKGILLIDWIDENRNNIIVLTETKLKCKDDVIAFNNKVNKATKKSFWIFCNYFKDDAKHGVITLIPRKFFFKPNHKVLKEGMVTESKLFLKSKPNSEITLISYYNPNPSKYNNLCKTVLEKNTLVKKVIIAGDFNQITNVERDVKRIKGEKPNVNTQNNNLRKANFFFNLINDCNLNFTEGKDVFTFKLNNINDEIYRRIDWILFSSYFKNKSNELEIEDPPFETDHFIVKQTLSLKGNQNESEPKQDRQFQIPDQYFKNPTFISKLKENLKKVNKISSTNIDKLKKMIDIAINTAKEYKKKKDIDKKQKKQNLRKELKKNKERRKKCNNSNKIDEEKTKLIEQVDKVFWKEIEEENWNKKIEFEKIKGPNKVYSRYLKLKTQVKSKLDHLTTEDGNQVSGKEAANHAKEVYEKVYQNEEIEMESISKLEHGEIFNKKIKDILNKKFTEKEIRNAIKMTPNKTPGPSGIRITFFKKFINQFVPILTKLANEALSTGNVDNYLLNGLITLIPKKEDSDKVNDLRPITLLEIPRKIITKAMTTRIKQVLSENLVINNFQFCHPGRLIHENVHTLRLLIERSQIKGTNLHAAFLDCSKAFDYVNHNYLIEILKRRDVGENFLNFISCFLKGTSKIIFNGCLSEELKIDRGVPQGETLSPFLFILAIDPLLNTIQNDESIKGVKTGNKRVKVMAYADDLVLISKTREDLEKMLKHVRTYENASNAKLNEKKSQLLSFGKKLIEKIGDIEQSKPEDRVRHLGFFFNNKGLINNIDEILEKILKKLKIMRNLYPNFTTRVNIWKGYAISSLLYQSEIITISKQQISKFEQIEKWFLFRGNLNDPEIKSIDDLSNTRCKISLERLAQPKKFGGLNLRRIQDVFSAAKTKVLMRALKDDGKMKPCNILLFERSGYYFSEGSSDMIVHPFYLVDQYSRNFNNNWDWYKQASKIFSMIDKDCTMVPKVGDTLLDWYENEIIYFDGREDIKNYKVVNKTIPVDISHSSKKRLAEKKEIYLKESKKSKIDKVVSIGHRNRNETPVRTIPKKANPMDWLTKVKVAFIQLEKKKTNKISIGNILRVTVDEQMIPIYTERQKDWIKQGVNLKGLFTYSLHTISRIEDFKKKFLMSYWGIIEENCCLCNQPFNRMHIFKYCPQVEKWEESVYKKRKDNVDVRKIRIESMLNIKLSTHTFSWIYNWCIWKNYWQIKYEKFDKSNELESQIENFKEMIRFNEYMHLKYSKATLRDERIENVAHQTKFFSFFKLDKNYISDVKEGIKKKKKKKLVSNLKKRK